MCALCDYVYTVRMCCTGVCYLWHYPLLASIHTLPAGRFYDLKGIASKSGELVDAIWSPACTKLLLYWVGIVYFNHQN